MRNNSNVNSKKYLLLIMLSIVIILAGFFSGNKQKASSPTTSLVSTQEVFLKNMTPHFKQSGKLYRKYKKVYARKAVKGEKIITITDDGVETSNTAKEGDIVVKNQTGAQEKYIMSSKKFNERYLFLREAEDGYSEYSPIGKVIGLELTPALLVKLGFDDEFKFIAPWGEEMVAKKGDYIVCPPGYDEAYRIAKKEFFETYKLDEK